jgi:hypothetical protein
MHKTRPKKFGDGRSKTLPPPDPGPLNLNSEAPSLPLAMGRSNDGPMWAGEAHVSADRKRQIVCRSFYLRRGIVTM